MPAEFDEYFSFLGVADTAPPPAAPSLHPTGANSVLHCAKFADWGELHPYLLESTLPVPADWPHETPHLVQSNGKSGLMVWHLAFWYGCGNVETDLRAVMHSGLTLSIPFHIDTTRLCPLSRVAWVHRHALGGQPGIIALLPITRIWHAMDFCAAIT